MPPAAALHGASITKNRDWNRKEATQTTGARQFAFRDGEFRWTADIDRTVLIVVHHSNQAFRGRARKRGKSISRFMIEAACKVAQEKKRSFASLEIGSDYRMPLEASQNPKNFIRARAKAKHEIRR